MRSDGLNSQFPGGALARLAKLFARVEQRMPEGCRIPCDFQGCGF